MAVLSFVTNLVFRRTLYVEGDKVCNLAKWRGVSASLQGRRNVLILCLEILSAVRVMLEFLGSIQGAACLYSYNYGETKLGYIYYHRSPKFGYKLLGDLA